MDLNLSRKIDIGCFFNYYVMELLLLIITGMLAVSFLFSELFHRLGSSRVVGQIIAGIVLGLPIFSAFLFSGQSYIDALNSGDELAFILEMLSGLGIILLLLLTGLEIDYEKLKKVSVDASVISISAAVTPFVMGFLFTRYILHYPDLTSVIVGACMSVTAEGTKVVVLMELGKLKSRVGEIMLGAGIIDDIFEIFFLATILLIASENVSSAVLEFVESKSLCEIINAGSFCWIPVLLAEFIIFVAVSFLIFKIFPHIARYVRKEKSEVSEFMVVVIVGLFIAELSGFMGLGTIIGAFVAGIIIQLSIKDRREERKMVKDLDILTLGLIVPFFFISVGLTFDIQTILNNSLTVASIVLIATVGKILGSLIVKPFTSLDMRQLYLIGWGMNSRGAVELVIATIAYTSLPAGMFPIELYSALVSMAVITTLIFPFVLRYEIKKNPSIMD